LAGIRPLKRRKRRAPVQHQDAPATRAAAVFCFFR
jgi:hypothetical protein